MAKLIYSMLMSLDGYTEDERSGFGWCAPEDEEVDSNLAHRPLYRVGSSLNARPRGAAASSRPSNHSHHFLFNCGLNIVQVLQEGLFRHALEQQPHWDRQ